jgi:hypothetical protein
MTIQEFNNTLPSLKSDDALAEKIKAAYNAPNLPSAILNIATTAGRGAFLEGGLFCRRLSFNDILAAEHDMGVKFATLGILPLFDKGDNNFVVFDFHKNVWMLFNIVDETKFRTGKTLVELLK